MATFKGDINQGSTYTLRKYADDNALVVDSAVQPFFVDEITGVSLEGLKEAAEAADTPSELGGLSLPSLLEIKEVSVERFSNNKALGVAVWGRQDYNFSFPQLPKTFRSERRSVTLRRFIDATGSVLADGASIVRTPDGSALTIDLPSAERTIIVRERSADFTDLQTAGDGASNIGKWNQNVFYGQPAGTVLYDGTYPVVHGFTTTADSSRKLAFHFYRQRPLEGWHTHFPKPDGTVGVAKPNEELSNQTALSEPESVPT